MATCSLCPPDSRDIPGHEMEEHRRTTHPEDRTLQVGGSTIVRDAADDTEADVAGEDGEWHH